MSVNTDDSLTEFSNLNNWRIHPPDWEYHRKHLAHLVNGIKRFESSKDMAHSLRVAATLLEERGDQPWAMADLYCFLQNATAAMPEIPGWTVIKHYGDRDSKSHWYGRTTVWCATLTEEHARQLAPAIEEHFAKKYPHHPRDTFTVELGAARPIDFIHPSITAEKYVRNLG